MFSDRMEMTKENDQIYGSQILATKANYTFILPVYRVNLNIKAVYQK